MEFFTFIFKLFNFYSISTYKFAEEGLSVLATGSGATAFGYFVQGWFKFGGVELFKIKAVEYFGED